MNGERKEPKTHQFHEVLQTPWRAEDLYDVATVHGICDVCKQHVVLNATISLQDKALIKNKYNLKALLKYKLEIAAKELRESKTCLG